MTDEELAKSINEKQQLEWTIRQLDRDIKTLEKQLPKE